MTKTVLDIRKDFPYLNEEKVGKKVIYLDNAATSQKPQAVIDTITNYYSYQNGSLEKKLRIFLIQRERLK